MKKEYSVATRAKGWSVPTMASGRSRVQLPYSPLKVHKDIVEGLKLAADKAKPKSGTQQIERYITKDTRSTSKDV